MVWLRSVGLALVAAGLVVSCSSGGGTSVGSEKAGEVAEAIIAACNQDTIGLPCDPDGPAGAKQECEGMCALGLNGLVGCRSITAGSLNGVICGTTNGVGDNACRRYCSGKTCLASNAPLGSACRPTSKATPCDGQCDGAGKCAAIGASACDFGRDEQLCKFATCDFSQATACKTENLLAKTVCSDNNACAIGKCNALGACVPGPIVGCNDGNSCTDDSCDPQGGCVGVNNDANECSDGNACFTGEHCASGACVPGTDPVDCADTDACTIDTCDPNTGCAHVPKSCDDGDACTVDSCNAVDGSCKHEAKDCNDSDACTTDTCDVQTGCVLTPKSCDDGDACTTDTCVAGTCGSVAVVCDDHDACTTDTCANPTGCTTSPIPDCAAGGAGGEGGEPTSNGGEPNATGGSGGMGGTSTAGSSASGSESGGTAGNATSGTAGTGQGGGGAVAGTSAASAGEASSEGGADSSGAGSSATDNSSSDSSGCGCRTVGSPSSRGSNGALALALLGMAAFVRRRRAA
jgi:MYXO-CTERM domain-containing protein